MASISDIIENFILKTLGEDNSIDLSRNELAGFFSCAPSQINYVLETRFTVDRGFLVESRRGGGGFIKVTKLRIQDDSELADLVLESVGDELSERRMVQIMDRLVRDNVITKREESLLAVSLSDDSLTMPIIMRDKVRSKAFKAVLLSLLKSEGGAE